MPGLGKKADATDAVTDAEWQIMEVLWEKESATAAEIVARITAEKDVGMRTVKTYLHRLIAKKAVTFTRDKENPRVYHYQAAWPREAVLKSKTQRFLDRFFGANRFELLTHLISEHRLKDSELACLEEIIRKSKKKGSQK